jgi:two-component system chemotaxis response regulator CheY
MMVSRGSSVLVVDDQSSSVAVTQSILSALGFRDIDTATSVPSAVERVRSKKYDLVFSDWHMAPLDGPELYRQITKRSYPHKPRFYFLTMDGRWGCAATARQLGADGLIVKTCRPMDLFYRINEAVGQA